MAKSCTYYTAKKKQHFSFLICDTLEIDKLIKSILFWKLFVYSFICYQAQLCSSNLLRAILNWVKLCKNQVCKTLYNSTFCWFFIFFHNSISAHCSASASSANSLIGRSKHIFMKKNFKNKNITHEHSIITTNRKGVAFLEPHNISGLHAFLPCLLDFSYGKTSCRLSP